MEVVRAVVVVVAALPSACLFPSLDGLTGSDASIVDAAGDTATNTDAMDAADAGFTAGIGCGAATPDLLAYYTVDEGTGTTVNDCVSPQNVGNILNPTHTAWVAGKHGGALEIDPFAGVCVTIDFASPTFVFGGTNAQSFTVAMWIYVIALPATGEIGYLAGQSSNITAAGWRFSVAPGGTIQLAVPSGSGGTTNVTGQQIAPGAWHHVAAVYSGATSAVYLDGKPGAPQSGLPVSFAADVASDHMRIGCSSDDQHQLHARVDDVRFYGRALSAAEIAIVQNAN
jgi:hypothetical protein